MRPQRQQSVQLLVQVNGPEENECRCGRSTYYYYRSLNVPRMQKTKSLKLHFWGSDLIQLNISETKHISIFSQNSENENGPKITSAAHEENMVLFLSFLLILKRKLIFNNCLNTLKGSWIDHWSLITKDIQIHCLFVLQIFKSVISGWDEHKTMTPTFTWVCVSFSTQSENNYAAIRVLVSFFYMKILFFCVFF